MVKYIGKICLILLVILVCFCFNNVCIAVGGPEDFFTEQGLKIYKEYKNNPDIIKKMDKAEVEKWIEILEREKRLIEQKNNGQIRDSYLSQIGQILTKLETRKRQLNQQQIESSGEHGGTSRPIVKDDVSPKTIDETMKGASDWIQKADTTGTFNEPVFILNMGYIYNIFFACGMVIAVGCGVVLGIKFITSSVEGQAKVKELLLPYCIGCLIIFGAFGIWKIVINFMEMFN